MIARVMIRNPEGEPRYVQVEAQPATILGIDYPYFIIHNVVKDRGCFNFAFTISDYRTGMRVLPSSQMAYSEVQAVEMTTNWLSTYGSDHVQRVIEAYLQEYGAANEVNPADWPS